MTNTFKKSFLLFAAVVMASTIWAVDLVVSNTTNASETFSEGSVLYSIDSDGRATSSTKFGSGKDIVSNGQKTKGVAFVDKRFVVKFPVAVSSVTIYGYNSSSGRTLNKISTSTTMTKSSYTDITSSSNKNSSSSAPNYNYTFTANWTNAIAADTYIWFEFNNSCNFYQISYTTSGGGGGTTPVTPTVSSVTVAPASATMDPNDTQQLTATVTVNPATADQTVTWTSSNKNVATVSTSGLVTAVAQGSATITATSNLDNTKSGTCAVTVNAPAAPEPVTGIALNKVTTTIAIGSSETLTVTYNPANANTGKAVNWTSSDQSVATVDNTGKVTGVAAGTATITAISTTDNTITASCTVTVQAIPVTGVTLNPTTANVQVNGTTTLTADVQPTNATNKKVTWSTGDATIATVNSNGVVTGVAAGQTTITATTADGNKTAICNVTVTAGPPVPSTNLTLHEPGVYEEKLSKGGYATNLVETGGREYEVYYANRDTEGDYATLTTRTGDRQNGIENTTSETYCKSADGWVEADLTSISGDDKKPKAAANGEFAEVYDEWRMKGQSLKIHIKGFDQFSYYGYDKNVDIDSKTGTFKKNQRFQVFIDSVMQPETQCGTSASVRRYDISVGEHVIEVKALSDGDSRLHAFSLRVAQVPHTKYLKGNDSTQIVMQNTALRPITYYTKYNSFGETKLVWDGLEATGISLQLKGSSDIGDTLVVTGIASCPVGVYPYFITTYYNNVPIGSIPGKFEVQSDIKALTTTSAEGYQGMNINPINFSYHALSADSITLTWENGNAPGGVTGSGADGLYSITGAPQNSGTFIYTVTVSGGNSISDTLFIEELVLGANPVLYLYKNARAYLQDGVYQYLSSTDGGYNLVPFTAINGKRSDSEYNRFKAIIISEDVDADNPEAIELIRDGASLPILNLNGFTYAKDEMRLGWGDPDNGAIDPSKTNKQQGCKITIERSNHPIYSKLLSITEGKEVKILDNYVQNGVMPIAIDNIPYKAACLATAPTRGVEYYDAGPLQTAIHEIPTDQRPGKYICMPLARQVTLSSDGKKLVKGIMEYLLSPTPASLTTPELRITKFIVGDDEAVINETEKTIKLQLTKAQYDEMDLTAAKPKITLADPIYSHVTPASNEEVNLQYATIPTLSKAYIVSDFVNRVVYQFMIQLINPQDIEEVYEIGQWVNIFDIYGRKVTTTNEDIYTMDLPHGMYIVVTENGNTLKIMR